MNSKLRTAFVTALAASLSCADDPLPPAPVGSGADDSSGTASSDAGPDTGAADTSGEDAPVDTSDTTSTDSGPPPGDDSGGDTSAVGSTSSDDTTSDTTTGDDSTGPDGDGGSTSAAQLMTSTSGGSDDGGSSTGIVFNELDAFPTPQPFGDQVTETDLIGTWNLPTDGSAPGYSMRLSIDDTGHFEYVEHDGACVPVVEGSGQLWVESPQLVMLFEEFSEYAPFDVMSKFNWNSEAPFLLRAGYAPVIGHLGLSAPPSMRVALPWGSRGYARTVGGSTTAVDTWVSETELWDVRPGETEVDIVARDRWTLTIDGSPSAWLVIRHWWFEDGIQSADPIEYYLVTVNDALNGYVDIGGDLYVYVGNRMASWEPGDNFQKNGPTACP